MTFRCVHLGMVVPRSPETEPMRRAIWRTHAAHNLAVWEFERLLLLMRGAGYDTALERTKKPPRKKERLRAWEKKKLTKHDWERTARREEEAVRREALREAREAQSRNGGAGGSDEEVLSLLRSLYEDMVPSSVDPGKGEADAQKKANAFIGNLCVRGSMANLDCARLVSSVPSWLTGYRSFLEESDSSGAVPGEILSEASEWVDSDECRTVHWVQKGTTPGWKKLVKKGRPASEWLPAFDKWFKAQEKKAGRTAPVILRLNELGLLPLMDGDPLYRLMRGKGNGVCKWGLGAFKSALGALSTWESWNAKTGGEYAKAVEDTRKAAEAVEEYRAEARILRRYEKERREELTSLFGEEREYHLTRKQVKGWHLVRAAWLQAMEENRRVEGKSLEEALGKLVSKVQGDVVRKHGKHALRSRFGDHHLFRWLAKAENHGAWVGDGEALWKFASLRSAEARQRLTKQCARYRPPHPRLHPRWVEYELKDKPSSNLPKFQLKEDLPGKLLASVPLLYRTEDGLLEERSDWFRLATSRQVRKPDLQEVENGLVVYYTANSLHLTSKADVRSSFLILDRKAMDGMSEERLERGDVKVRLGAVLDVTPQCPPDWIDRHGNPKLPGIARTLLRAQGNGGYKKEDLVPGLRVLSCNLNLGCNAISVFELMDLPEGPGKNLAYHVHGNLWAVHERSHVIFLPGEKPTPNDRLQRDYLYGNLKRLKRMIRDVKDLHSMASAFDSEEWDEKGRREIEKKVAKEKGDGPVTRLFGDLVKKNEAFTLTEARARFEGHCRNLSDVFSKWVKSQRPRRVRDKAQLNLRARARQLEDEGDRVGAREAWALAEEYGKLAEPLERESAWLISLEGVEYLEECLKTYKSWQSALGRDPSDGKFHAYLWDHVTNVKDERVKLVSSRIVKAALGYDDKGLRRWEPCRIVLFEDKGRYQFRSDRPKRENRALMAWCHRAIESTTRMQAAVYGICVPEKAVNAGYLSRFDAATGAPGIRCARPREKELSDVALKKLGELGFDGAIECGPSASLVPREGGNLLASVSPGGGLRVVSAEVNAAWGIQRRFWSRHSEVTRIPVYFSPEGDEGKRVHSAPASMGKRVEGAVKAALKGTCFDFGVVPKEGCVPLRPKKAKADDEAKKRKSKASAFRDPSGLVLDPSDWYLSTDFWSLVEKKIVALLLEHQPAAVRT